MLAACGAEVDPLAVVAQERRARPADRGTARDCRALVRTLGAVRHHSQGGGTAARPAKTTPAPVVAAVLVPRIAARRAAGKRDAVVLARAHRQGRGHLGRGRRARCPVGYPVAVVAL